MDLFFAEKTNIRVYNLTKHKNEGYTSYKCVNHDEYTKCVQTYGIMDVEGSVTMILLTPMFKTMKLRKKENYSMYSVSISAISSPQSLSPILTPFLCTGPGSSRTCFLYLLGSCPQEIFGSYKRSWASAN